ncbi:MAG: hypothetical protein ABIH50_01795 [bacterium]
MKRDLKALFAYIFWIPSLYQVLTEKNNYHARQALVLWTWIFIGFFTLRSLIKLLWSIYYIPYLEVFEVLFSAVAWGYAVYCGQRAFQGETFKLFQ